MDPPTLTTLPDDVMYEILIQANCLGTFSNLAQTCRQMRGFYQRHGPSILKNYLMDLVGNDIVVFGMAVELATKEMDPRYGMAGVGKDTVWEVKKRLESIKAIGDEDVLAWNATVGLRELWRGVKSGRKIQRLLRFLQRCVEYGAGGNTAKPQLTLYNIYYFALHGVPERSSLPKLEPEIRRWLSEFSSLSSSVTGLYGFHYWKFCSKIEDRWPEKLPFFERSEIYRDVAYAAGSGGSITGYVKHFILECGTVLRIWLHNLFWAKVTGWEEMYDLFQLHLDSMDTDDAVIKLARSEEWDDGKHAVLERWIELGRFGRVIDRDEAVVLLVKKLWEERPNAQKCKCTRDCPYPMRSWGS